MVVKNTVRVHPSQFRPVASSWQITVIILLLLAVLLLQLFPDVKRKNFSDYTGSSIEKVAKDKQVKLSHRK